MSVFWCQALSGHRCHAGAGPRRTWGLVRGTERVPVRRGPAPPQQLVVRLPSVSAQDIASTGIRTRPGDSECPSACSRHRSWAALAPWTVPGAGRDIAAARSRSSASTSDVLEVPGTVNVARRRADVLLPARGTRLPRLVVDVRSIPRALGSGLRKQPLSSHVRARAREGAAPRSDGVGSPSDNRPTGREGASPGPERDRAVVPRTPSPYDEDKGTYTVLSIHRRTPQS